ncbi:MAG: hypothetical protein KME08_20235 [Aphanothece sp. CMT-3BRIN-NPC111]|jgi:outer membrane biosynthesis protein TonB|nr:hypothetical protein [Aphanothece sp. CMT-3BRIN-NPC111]
MFGFIKNLFNGILGFITGLFGPKQSQDKQSSLPKAKKGGGYFMQLDESEDSKPTATSQAAKSNSAAEAKKSEQPASQSAAEAKKSEQPAAEAKKPEQPTPEAKKPEPAKAPARAATAEPAKKEAAAEPKKPEPVAANNGKVQPQKTSTFAPDYLIQTSSSTSRRRPGPSMDMFRDMARQVKTPNA